MKPRQVDRGMPILTVASLFAVLLPACTTTIRIDDETSSSSSSSSGSGGSSSAGGSSMGGSDSTSVVTSTSTSTGTGGETAQDAGALVAAACPDVASEAHYCITIGYPNAIWAVGPDSGSRCFLGDVEGLERSDTTSIAVVGPHVHGCTYDLGVWRASVLGGPAELLDVECDALTEYDGGFLLVDTAAFDTLRLYPSFGSIDGGSPIEEFAVDGHFSRITARESTLFGAWHSTDMIERHPLPDGEMQPLVLAGFDDWVEGMSVTSDGRLYVVSWGRILAFDAETGEELQVTEFDDSFSALHCWSN